MCVCVEGEAGLLQVSQHPAQGLWSSGTLELWPREGEGPSGILLGEGSVSSGEKRGQMQPPGTSMKPDSGFLWPVVSASSQA